MSVKNSDFCADLFQPFLEGLNDGRCTINCGHFAYPCPNFNDDDTSKNVWDCPKNCCELDKLNGDSTECRRWRCLHRPTIPICFDDQINVTKTPKWTNKKFISKQLRDCAILHFADKHIEENVDGKEIISLKNYKDRAKWVNMLPSDETETGPFVDNEFLADCLSLVNIDQFNSIIAFSNGRMNDSLRLSNISWTTNIDNYVQCDVKNISNALLSSELLEIRNFPYDSSEGKVDFLCRTFDDIQLVSFCGGSVTKCQKLLPSCRAKSLITNPYITNEFCLSDIENNFLFGSVNESDEVVTKNVRPISHINVKTLEWSDHPRCVWMHDVNNVYLNDVRQRNDAKFFTAPLELDVIRSIRRIDDDSRYVFLTTDQTLFLLDQRQSFRPVVAVQHMSIDCAKYLNVSHKISTQRGETRAVTIVGRQLNEIISTPLLWNVSTKTVCELEPPFVVWSPEQTYNWIQMYSPLLPYTKLFEQRILAPFRGVATKKISPTRSANIFLTDVGDVHYSVMDFSSVKNPNDDQLDSIASVWKTFIETRSSIYASDQRNIAADVSFLLDLRKSSSKNLEDSIEKCKFCGLEQTQQEGNCPGCLLEPKTLENLVKLVKSGDESSLLAFNSSEKTDVIPSEKTLSEIDELIISCWKNEFEEKEIRTE